MTAGVLVIITSMLREGSKKRRCQLCAPLSRRFSRKPVYCISLATLTWKGMFNQGSATAFFDQRRWENVHWQGDHLLATAGIPGARVRHSLSKPAYSWLISKALAPFLHKFRASQHVAWWGKAEDWHRWTSERFTNLLWDTQQSKKQWKLALDAGKRHQRQECKSTIWNIVPGVTSSPWTTRCGHDLVSGLQFPPQQRNFHSNGRFLVCTKYRPGVMHPLCLILTWP